jgi:tRNA threonylcarbamoyladenosine modification (KEOPS) complex Cgi121 subunit
LESKLSNFHILIFCCAKLEPSTGTRLIEEIRHRFEKVYIQGFNKEAVFGLQHVIESLKITLEALKRGTMAAKRPELDLLLRISCTTQISKAIKHAGMRPGICTCFVMFSKYKRDLLRARNCAQLSLHDIIDPELILNAPTRRIFATKLGLEAVSNFVKDDNEFLRYLIERAALITG